MEFVNTFRRCKKWPFEKKKHFKELVRKVTGIELFMYRGLYYRQIDSSDGGFHWVPPRQTSLYSLTINRKTKSTSESLRKVS